MFFVHRSVGVFQTGRETRAGIDEIAIDPRRPLSMKKAWGRQGAWHHRPADAYRPRR
jgi:hypothetical protein